LYVMNGGKWVEIAGKAGADGINGKNVELRQHKNSLQWRWQDTKTWHTLLSLSQITGNDGKDGKDGEDGKDGKDGREIELRRTDTAIEWRYVGEKWKVLITLK